MKGECLAARTVSRSYIYQSSTNNPELMGMLNMESQTEIDPAGFVHTWEIPNDDTNQILPNDRDFL